MSNTNPTKTVNGISIYQCSVTNENDKNEYAANQLVVRQDLRLQYQQLQSVDVSASPTSVTTCGGSSTLSTTAYFKLITKTEDDTTTAETQTSASVTASYSDDESYTTIDGNKITFEKNSINYPTSTKADERDSIVTGSYTYSGVNKTDNVTITQNENNVGNWVWKSDTTTSLAISPTALTFGSCEQTIDYSVTRYYDSYYEKYDSCSVKMDSKTDKNNIIVTPSEASADGSFSATTTNVSIDTNTGAYRTGTLTVKYDGKSQTAALAQAASQQGRYYGAAYGSDTIVYTVGDDEISCDGGSITFKAYHYTRYYKDYVDKDHCGNVTGSGTTEFPTTTDVTNSATWTTDVGTIEKGVLTVDSTTSDRTISIIATYDGISGQDFAYQTNCKPIEKTPITVKFCGEHETKEWDSPSSHECYSPVNEQIVKSDISYSITGIDTELVPAALKIFATASKYHLGKHIEWEVEFTPSSKSGEISLNLFEGDGLIMASGLCSEYEQAQKVSVWGAYLTDDTYFTLTVDDRVNKDCNDSTSSGSTGTTTPSVISDLSLTNNLPGGFKVNDPNSTKIEEVEANGTSKTSFNTVITNGGSITVNVPKNSMVGENGNICGSCFILINAVSNSGDVTVKTYDGNFTIDIVEGFKWIPNSKNYVEGTTESITFYSGEKEICIIFEIE